MFALSTVQIWIANIIKLTTTVEKMLVQKSPRSRRNGQERQLTVHTLFMLSFRFTALFTANLLMVLLGWLPGYCLVGWLLDWVVAWVAWLPGCCLVD